ncbi:MAG: hypothetical protein GWN84_17230 [Gammaproteobacteria bacterium]|nr:hypothetical protein [Gammaproteobacteria bacterium]NIR84581.1 hypothetical protein [Gammaproteobacteria bacterium]NIR90484.1 hypothetical protein [Gammaproteobacteria bacterium]NIU05632.1 hypothetical protein [Gammaproteobacteria bacterium]NIV52771.1 hypothetical protein [Gammaproteobacteria bacterium]
MYSLRARVLATVSLVLLGCFLLTVLALDVAFRRTAEQAVRERLEVQIVALLAAAELSEDAVLSLPASLPEARLTTLGSGLYARIVDGEGRRVWRSPSALSVDIDYPGPLAPGRQQLVRTRTSEGVPVFALSMGVDWELDATRAHAFTVSVAESMEPYHAQLDRFRQQLMVWFGSALILLIVVQALTLRWLMRPLRRVAREIAEVEAGTREELGSGYPTELAGVARNFNALIRTERARLARYRESLGNLAHSLKTPLAVIRNALERGGRAPPAPDVAEQLERMDAIVRYQLQRAAMSGAVSPAQRRVPVREALAKVRDSLSKIHADKGPCFVVEVRGQPVFHGEEGDLLEILGNLLDNACKWCERMVRVRAGVVSDPWPRTLELVVEDDGPGIPDEVAAQARRRGVRADPQVPGSGLGLAVTQELIDLHGGTLTITRSHGDDGLGGAAVRVLIPEPGGQVLQ